jgi:4-carboxymuconolactone decarboxylase
MTDHREDAIDELFERGLSVRREVFGPEYVDNSLKAPPFAMASSRSPPRVLGLGVDARGRDRKTRSPLNLAMLTALNRSPESSCTRA